MKEKYKFQKGKKPPEHKNNCGCFRCSGIPWNKGLLKENNPLTGIKRPKYIGKAVSLANKGRIFTEDHRQKLRLDKLGKTYEERMGVEKALATKLKKNSRLEVVQNQPYLKKVYREKRIAQIEVSRLNGLPLLPNQSKEEKFILDNFEKLLTFPIIRQYKVDGYFIDGYCPILNLAFEIDDDNHRYYKERDVERQSYIEDKLGCRFIRIPLEEIA